MNNRILYAIIMVLSLIIIIFVHVTSLVFLLPIADKFFLKNFALLSKVPRNTNARCYYDDKFYGGF